MPTLFRFLVMFSIHTHTEFGPELGPVTCPKFIRSIELHPRKTFNTLGVGMPALSLVWLAFVGCDALQAAAAMCVCLGSNGLIYGGLFVRSTGLG